jgi:hypothetical protein
MSIATCKLFANVPENLIGQIECSFRRRIIADREENIDICQGYQIACPYSNTTVDTSFQSPVELARATVIDRVEKPSDEPIL